jgi:CxxC motif-containing protein (DUF1111 family)
MNNQSTFISGIIVITFLIISCSKFEPGSPADDEILDGPLEGLSFEQNRQFLAGDVAFNDEIFTPATGLGPIFVATSCGSCHAGDGKGTPFTTLTRYGQTDSSGNQFMHLGGPQLQNRAIVGYQPELMPTGATFSKFTPPANTGLGLMEAVSDADILSMADPNDANGDGISGVPSYNFLPSFIIPSGNAIPQNGKYIHRFGKKAAAYNLLHQTVNAYNQDMGITSTFTPHDVYSGHTIDPEVSDKTVRDVVFYLQTLKAPIPRSKGNGNFETGKALFTQINCSGCHTPQLKTGFSPVTSLSNKTIYPYTDMLLHDMGTELDDGYTEGFAKTSEWRTPPLWGLGLSPNSQGGQYFLLHDGRAKSIEEAIMMHGGEAKKSRDSFNQLKESEKSAIIQFLKSL